MQNKGIHLVSFLLVVIGGLNWGLVGFFKYDLVSSLLGGSDSMIARIVFGLVGLGALYLLATHKKDCRTCNAGGESSSHGHDLPA
ncbi:DUF378 domain-containing protein [bacterium]|nr:DUF378 domain-containing protein [bacterium]